MIPAILYVEDDPINAFVMVKFLKNDFTITHVIDGETCLNYLTAERVDLILMDIHLGKGKMDGIETMKRIKEQPAFSSLPIMAVTSYALPEDRERFLNEGFDDYMAKPVDRKALIERIHHLLR
ncbi:MAG: response regulator [Cyclobacteriaceae bacterium]|nr:response regulator [Cyclobacteriaceae bacterium]